MQTNRVFHIILFIVAFGSAGSEASTSSFSQCVESLHLRGGISIRDSQIECLNPLSNEALSCQNSLFLDHSQNPQQALRSCKETPPTSSALVNGYHGSYEKLPEKNNKKTVCSITVNSENERNQFRSQFSSEDYNWVELLPDHDSNRFIVRDNNWLKRACGAQLKCDVLVISGHFAESFIGDSGFQISARELQNSACSQGCDEFFKSVKEVYLFGCNTLARKTRDSRSIDDYVTILTLDGLSPQQAQRVAARRYTNYGVDYFSIARMLFSQADHIYGFPSVGPSGASVEKPLRNYLHALNESHLLSDDGAFRKNLGAVGMIKTRGFGNPVCESRDSILQNIKTAADVGLFVDHYGISLPVATVDVLTEALEKSLISFVQHQHLKEGLEQQWSSLDLFLKRARLCPLILSEHADWLPSNLDCKTETGWISGR